MITETYKPVEDQHHSGQCSPDVLVGSDMNATLEVSNIFDRSVALIIDNSGKVLMVQSVRQGTGETIWELPTNGITKPESPAEAAARGLKENAGFIVVPNYLLPLSFVTSEVESSNSKIHLFLHKTSQVRYSTPSTFSSINSKTVKWVHKFRLAQSIKAQEVTDFGTVSLFEKAVLLGII